MTQKIKAKLSISRRFGGDNTSIAISIECKTSGIEFVELELTPEEFGNAVTGLSSIPVECEVRGLDKVGMKRERRIELFDVVLASLKKSDNEAAILSAAERFEVDGWKASAYHALNVQDGKMLIDSAKRLYRCKVEFFRWVDQEQQPCA